jgi:hypothetical protein
MQGMIEFRNALSDIVEEFGTDDGGFQVRRTVLWNRNRNLRNRNFFTSGTVTGIGTVTC